MGSMAAASIAPPAEQLHLVPWDLRMELTVKLPRSLDVSLPIVPDLLVGEGESVPDGLALAAMAAAAAGVTEMIVTQLWSSSLPLTSS
jgi:hypothetical protein